MFVCVDIEYTQEQISSESINVTEGGQMDVLCRVGGIPTPSYKWFDPIRNVVASVQLLNISDVELTDRGRYRCEAHNGASTLNYDVQLNIEGNIFVIIFYHDVLSFPGVCHHLLFQNSIPVIGEVVNSPLP